MLVAAAVCPHPPLLIPEIAAGAAAELDTLRTACDEAVRRLVTSDPDTVLVVGAGQRTGRTYPTAAPYLAPWGLDRPASRPSTADISARLTSQETFEVDDEPPLALTVGGWLLSRTTVSADVQALTVAPDTDAATCAALGREACADPHDRVALLVMGDGSACRSESAPAYFDPRAAAFDSAVAGALARADVAALMDLDDALAHDLRVAGLAAWRVLAGAAEGRPWHADLLYDDAPYGVGYFVASWVAVQ